MIIVTVVLPALFIVVSGLFIMWFFSKSKPASTPVAETKSANDGLRLDESTGLVLDASGEHTLQHGHYLATACDLAYYPEADGAPKFRSQLNLCARLISVDNTQAYVGENADSIVVAFRGSETPNSIDGFKDWLLTNARNFLILPEGRIGTDFAAAGVGARFHRGFMEALAEIWEPLYSAVEEAMRRKERPLWITGHSLGGAVALMAAWRFHQKFLSVHQVCTFGAPMIGNAAASEAYHREFAGRIIRYVDHGDMVPKLPTMSLLNNEYGHVQREIILGVDDDRSAASLVASAAEQCVTGDVTTAVADGLWTQLHSGIEAHLMGNYISRISNDIG